MSALSGDLDRVFGHYEIPQDTSRRDTARSYSYRNASIGWIRMARRTGKQQANRPTKANNAAAAASIIAAGG